MVRVTIEIEDTVLYAGEEKEKINVSLELNEGDPALDNIRTIIVEKSRHIKRGSEIEQVQKNMELK